MQFTMTMCAILWGVHKELERKRQGVGDFCSGFSQATFLLNAHEEKQGLCVEGGHH